MRSGCWKRVCSAWGRQNPSALWCEEDRHDTIPISKWEDNQWSSPWCLGKLQILYNLQLCRVSLVFKEGLIAVTVVKYWIAWNGCGISFKRTFEEDGIAVVRILADTLVGRMLGCLIIMSLVIRGLGHWKEMKTTLLLWGSKPAEQQGYIYKTSILQKYFFLKNGLDKKLTLTPLSLITEFIIYDNKLRDSQKIEIVSKHKEDVWSFLAQGRLSFPSVWLCSVRTQLLRWVWPFVVADQWGNFVVNPEALYRHTRMLLRIWWKMLAFYSLPENESQIQQGCSTNR